VPNIVKNHTALANPNETPQAIAAPVDVEVNSNEGEAPIVLNAVASEYGLTPEDDRVFNETATAIDLGVLQLEVLPVWTRSAPDGCDIPQYEGDFSSYPLQRVLFDSKMSTSNIKGQYVFPNAFLTEG
jgi:hypothetical protein